MLIVLGTPVRADSARVDALLAKPGKDGRPAVRGPRVEAAVVAPLAALSDGDKLHIVADGGRAEVAGYSAEALACHLCALGLRRDVRLKQIHLIVDDTGTGGLESFAERFSTALATEGFHAFEIKAPRGKVSCDARGNVLIAPAESEAASGASLNYYTGPGLQEKHRPGGRVVPGGLGAQP